METNTEREYLSVSALLFCVVKITRERKHLVRTNENHRQIIRHFIIIIITFRQLVSVDCVTTENDDMKYPTRRVKLPQYC